MEIEVSCMLLLSQELRKALYIHINFMISRVDRYMRRTTLQNARTCGGILFPIKSGKRKGLNKFIINHYMNLLCSSLLVVPFDHAVLKKLTFCN